MHVWQCLSKQHTVKRCTKSQLQSFNLRTIEQAPLHPLRKSRRQFLRWPKIGDIPVLVMSMIVRPNDIELRMKHTSSTGILPPVNFTHRAEKLKISDAKNAQVIPELHNHLQRACTSYRDCVVGWVWLTYTAGSYLGALDMLMRMLPCLNRPAGVCVDGGKATGALLLSFCP